MIQKYQNKTLPQLLEIATKEFNSFIRNRDKYKSCISCDKRVSYKQAGHFYSANTYPTLRFSELNVHGQCPECNCSKYGNVDKYRKNILLRIGKIQLEVIDFIAESSKSKTFKWDRVELIETIEKYKKLNK